LDLKNETFPVEAVIFDLDGTLIDSIDIYLQILKTALEQVNIPPISKTKIIQATESGDFDWEMVLPETFKDKKDDTIKRITRIIEDIYPDLFRQYVTLIPGTSEMLKQISVAGMKLGMVTSTPKNNMKEKLLPLKDANRLHLFEAIIKAEDAPQKKPAKDPLLLCADQLDVPAGKCVYLGDMRTDIRAGKAAGMKTIGVLSGFDTYQGLMAEHPDAVINSIAQLHQAIQISTKRNVLNHALSNN
jgi:phosphoglycolate phosphatase